MQPVRVGCLNSLYESVANLEEENLWTETCKEMLLNPRNSMESYCRNLKLNIDDTDPTNYFICENWECSRRREGGALLSSFRNLRCRCGKLMNREMSLPGSIITDGFAQKTATFIICDDLSVMPNGLGTSVVLLQNLGIEDLDSIEEITVNVSEKEVVDLLKCSLLSKTPLTDLFLKKKQFLENFIPRNQSQFEIGELPTDDGRKMVVKILIRKSNSKVLFAQGEEDFTDFLFNFLTFPLGGVLHMLEGCSSLSCVDKLYKSMTELSADRYLTSQGLKSNLANLKCAQQFKVRNHILPIDAEGSPLYYCFSNPKRDTYGHYIHDTFEGCMTTEGNPSLYSYQENVPLYFVDPTSLTGETSSSRGFVKGPSLYMVTDDLIVTPMSSISSFSFLKNLKVSLSDLEERVISIGMKEGLSILKASLSSTSAMTNGLHQIIRNIKEEN